MAAYQGFTTVAPDTRFGASSAEIGMIGAQGFTLPEGSWQGTRIGVWAHGNGAERHITFAIFTHDATNNCPESLVTNSTSGETHCADGSFNHAYYDYSTLPSLTGGVGGTTYWIVAFCDNVNIVYSRDAATSSITVGGSATYPTFPTGDEWHDYLDKTENLALYVVYQAAGGGPTAITVTRTDNLNG